MSLISPVSFFLGGAGGGGGGGGDALRHLRSAEQKRMGRRKSQRAKTSVFIPMLTDVSSHVGHAKTENTIFFILFGRRRRPAVAMCRWRRKNPSPRAAPRPPCWLSVVGGVRGRAGGDGERVRETVVVMVESLAGCEYRIYLHTTLHAEAGEEAGKR